MMDDRTAQSQAMARGDDVHREGSGWDKPRRTVQVADSDEDRHLQGRQIAAVVAAAVPAAVAASMPAWTSPSLVVSGFVLLEIQGSGGRLVT